MPCRTICATGAGQSIPQPGKAAPSLNPVTFTTLNCSEFIDACIRAGCFSRRGCFTAFSILFFTESWRLSGFFLKKKPPSMISKRQHLNRKCSSARGTGRYNSSESQRNLLKQTSVTSKKSLHFPCDRTAVSSRNTKTRAKAVPLRLRSGQAFDSLRFATVAQMTTHL